MAKVNRTKELMLSANSLRNLLDYDASNGDFTWRKDAARNVMAGSIAGCEKSGEYRYITIRGVQYLAHRLAWLYVYGVWPERQVDHINGVKSDNRISNLRQATAAQNQHNRKSQRNNTSGVKGVSFHKFSRKWWAGFNCDGEKIDLGYFDSKEDAAIAVREARERHHAIFACHG